MRSITERPGERIAAERLDDRGARASCAPGCSQTMSTTRLKGRPARNAIVASSVAGFSAIGSSRASCSRKACARWTSRAGCAGRREHRRRARRRAAPRGCRARSTSPRRPGRASARTARWRARAAGAAGRRAPPSAATSRGASRRAYFSAWGESFRRILEGSCCTDCSPPLARGSWPRPSRRPGRRPQAGARTPPPSRRPPRRSILSRTLRRRLVVVRELHVELALAAGHARELARVLEHLRHRHLGADHLGRALRLARAARGRAGSTGRP